MNKERISIKNGRHAIVNGHRIPDDEYGAQTKGNDVVSYYFEICLFCLVVELNDHGLVFLVDILIVQPNSNDVFVLKMRINKMVDLKNIKIVHQQVQNVEYSINY